MQLTAIREALATQITSVTGLRCDPQARDSVSPPQAVVLPASPLISYADAMWPGAVSLNLTVLLLLSDGPPAEQVQQQMDDYLGVGSGQDLSIAAAVQSDPSLAGTCEFCVATSASVPGRLDYNGVTMWGARVQLHLGAV